MSDPASPPDLDKVRKFAEGLAKEGTYSHYTGGTRRIFTDASRRHIRLADEVERLRAELWECPECAFTFDRVHSDKDGGLSCPNCAEIRLIGELKAERVLVAGLTSQVEEIGKYDDRLRLELESEREASRGLREKLLTAENLVDDFRDASGLQTGGEYGDPSGVTPDHVRAEIKQLRAK